MSKGNETKASIINYVENFIDKRDNELNAASSGDEEAPITRGVDRDSIVIKTGGGSGDNYPHDDLVNICFVEIFSKRFSFE